MRVALRVAGSVVTIVILGILSTILVVWAYSNYVSPGKPVGTYQAFANTAGPWVSIFAGPLITYFVVKLATKRLESEQARKETLWMMGLYAAFDVSVLLGSRVNPIVWGFAAVSLLGRCMGAWMALRSRKVGT